MKDNENSSSITLLYKNWHTLWRKESDTRFYPHIWSRLRWINYSLILFFCLPNICCSSQTTGQNAVLSPEVRNFILCCSKFFPCGRIMLNISSKQSEYSQMFPFIITLADYSWTFCSSVVHVGRAQIAMSYWYRTFEKRYIYEREARTKCLLLGTDILNPKSCTLSYSQKDSFCPIKIQNITIKIKARITSKFFHAHLNAFDMSDKIPPLYLFHLLVSFMGREEKENPLFFHPHVQVNH